MEGTGRRRLRVLEGVRGGFRSGWWEVKACVSGAVSEGREVCWA